MQSKSKTSAGRPRAGKPAARRKLVLLPLAVALVGSLVAQPVSAADLSAGPTQESAQVATKNSTLAAAGQPVAPAMPRGTTSDPSMFDEARPSGLSFAAADSLVYSSSSSRSGTPSLAAGTTSRRSATFNPELDLAWSLDCDADAATAKPYCQEPTGYYWVHGDIRHRRRAWVVDPGNSAHPQAPQYEYSDGDEDMGMVGAREVLVRVADGCGLHADGYTDADGHYSILFPSWCGDKDATVTLYSLSAPGAGRQVALGVHTASPDPVVMGDLDDVPADYTIVAGEVGTFNPEADAKCPGSGFCIGGHELNRDFQSYEEGRLFQQGKYSRAGEVARALTIMETTMTALDYYRQLVSGDRLPQINLVLTDQPLQESDDTAFYNSGKRHLIYIPPWLEWSPFAVVHETSHYFDGWVLVEDGLQNYGRWGEPMANVRAGMILGNSYRVPSNSGWAEDMDVQGNWDSDAGEVLPGDVPESTNSGGPGQGWTWRILWDLHDGTGAEPIDFGFGDFDQWDGGGGSSNPLNHLINGVVMEYLPQRDGSVHPDYVDRGQPGPDIVDMLDGFACLYGMSHLQMQTLLHDVMSYNYDFAHCSEPDDVAPTR
ncbi:MAG TPA: hypothetical protein VHL54_05360 [Actinomycetota bacterium]|nr:hypothetical protein [Actinomycetota bacterium]